MLQSTAPESILAVAVPGLETVVAAECAALGLGGRVVPGGVEIVAPIGAARRLNLHARTPSRVLLRVASFEAHRFAELEAGVARASWERFLTAGAAVAVRASARKSRLHHTGAIAERVAAGVGRRLRGDVRLAGPAVAEEPSPDAAIGAIGAIVATIERDVVRLSIDTSGEPLHRRGHRLATAKAPVRETIAAAMIFASGWSGDAPLVDPFCGSGTIPLEAARLARRMAPGIDRCFAFEAWPEHDADAWGRERDDARSAELPARPGAIVASDRDAGAIEAARANCERGGVADDVDLRVASVSDARPPSHAGESGPGAIVTNPPHGRRIGDGDLTALYGRFGKVARERFRGWRVAMLTSSVRYETATRLAVEEVLRVRSGGQSLRLVIGRAMVR